MLPIPFTLSPQQRSARSKTQDVIPFLNKLIFQYTNPLSFETEPHSIHIIPLLRQHLDAYLYYIRYKTFDTTPSHQPFPVIFNPVQGVKSGTFYRIIHPQNLTLSIQDVFTTYIDKLIEHIENVDTPKYRPSLLESLKEKAIYFDVPDIDTKIIRHNNPHYWLQQDLLQVANFQYRFFQNIILDVDTIPQIKIFSHFLLKFFRFNYQLLWEQKDQNAYVNFRQVLTDTELLPFIIRNDFQHPFHNIPISKIDSIILNSDFLIEQSETFDNRPNMNSLQNTTNDHENVLSETSANRPNINLFQDNNTDDEPVIQRQPTTPQQPSQLKHDTAESVQDILTNPPNTSITTDSNAIQIPTRNITEHTDHIFNQEIPSTLSVTSTIDTQPPQTHHTIQRNYDPLPPPSENSTHSTPHNSPQHGSSNTFPIRQHPLHETQIHTNTTPIQPHQTLQYLPAQPSVSSNTSPILTINTLHTNPITNVITTSRNLSRPPLPLIQNNPLSYNLTSIILHSQSFSNNIQSTNTNIQPSAINFLPHIPSTTTQTIPPIQPIHTQPQTNGLKIPPTSFNPTTTHTIPPTTLPLSTLSTPTYINSATSISKPIKSFDGLDHNYTPEEYLQHNEALHFH